MTSHSRLPSVILFFISVVAAFAGLPNPKDLSDVEFALYHDLNNLVANRTFCYQLRQLAPDNKVLWIERVQRYLAQHGKDSAPLFEIIMLATGDPKTLRRYADLFSRSDGGPPWEVQVSADPALAAMVGDDLLKENNDPNPGGDVLLFGHASRTWELMRLTLRVAPEFSDPVKKWARAVPAGLWGEGEDIEIFREWWRANREVMRSGRYSEVQPGRTLPEWLDGLPDLDPPFEPGKPGKPIMFGNNDPNVIKIQYAQYLEAKRTGKPYPPPLQTIPPSPEDGADGTSGRVRRWIVIAIASFITAFILRVVWLRRRSRGVVAGNQESESR